ncbi:hypothetical protein M231_01329 [Tremella mesenterica]|uniref:Cytoplasmic protein n=1 Tax=Tremella mesenterica TaxID=5217 RepID=A0A4Q1BTL7_TREME|nr:hypothetical protein M231_01329 [Tremella mesenterica]
MPQVPSHSPATGLPTPPHYIHTSSAFFQDTSGRSLLLRGVNLSSSSKTPHNQPSWSLENFWEDGEAGKAEYIGRPLNLEDGTADVHLARLRAWGFNMLRYVFTWEALEHEGPGKYDEDYMDYVVRVLRKCKEWGFRVFMDPHQDVWSRFSGGSGAPLWTIYACGIDPRHITPTYGALLHNEYPQPSQFPSMIWSTNYTRLVSQTIFTLFFAGRMFAPKCIIDGMNIQDYLQDHFIRACEKLAMKIAEAGDLYDSCVIGWDSMNEPGEGMICKGDLSVVPRDQQLKKGVTPSPFEGMKLGMGQAVEVDNWAFGPLGPYKVGKEVLDPEGTKLWLEPDEEESRGGGKWGWKRGESWQLGICVWALHGVWDPVSSTLLIPKYFDTPPKEPSRTLDFVEDFFRPHFIAYAANIRLHHREAILFIQAPVFHPPPHIPEEVLRGRACNSPHYYDGLTLMTKHFNFFNADALGLIRKKYWSVIQAVRVGEGNIRKSIQEQLGILKQDTKDVLGDYPTLIGEIGCPYDMDDKKSYGYTEGGKYAGDYSSQQRAWDCSLNATDGPNCLSYTLWTYCPDNSHEWGDQWNGEDLSIWSSDDIINPDILYSDEMKSKSQITLSPNNPSDSIPTLSYSTLTSKPQTIISSTSTSNLSHSSTFFDPIHTPTMIESGFFSSSLIIDGARAPAAFSRPYPMKTVGIPTKLEFDISSTRFTLNINVTKVDSIEGGFTEIYLPFIHYASSLSKQTLLSQNQIQIQNDDDKEEEGEEELIRSSSTSKLLDLDGISDPTLDDKQKLAIAEVGRNGLKLNVEVDISIGTYEIIGQTLYWKYPIPTLDSQDISIQVIRKGGAIKRNEIYGESLGDKEKSWKDVMRMIKDLKIDLFSVAP